MSLSRWREELANEAREDWVHLPGVLQDVIDALPTGAEDEIRERTLSVVGDLFDHGFRLITFESGAKPSPIPGDPADWLGLIRRLWRDRGRPPTLADDLWLETDETPSG
jgi:hypothetical protein